MIPNFGEADGQEPRYHSVDQPTPTITSRGACNLILATMDEAAAEHLRDQGIDPRRLIYVDGEPHLLDIRFRMLENHELARAMGFDDDETEYEFHGNKGSDHQADRKRRPGAPGIGTGQGHDPRRKIGESTLEHHDRRHRVPPGPGQTLRADPRVQGPRPPQVRELAGPAATWTGCTATLATRGPGTATTNITGPSRSSEISENNFETRQQ